jgi:acyl transferase domain-containing protein
MGYQAPSIEGQKRVIEEALLIANVNPESITYVEGNGTGTLLGDSIEIEALARAFRTQTDKRGFCGIGSVKANIGHLTQAAGIASLIKTALSLKNKQLPPSPNCGTPNPQLQGTPFYVLQKCSGWDTNNLPRRAGINSFAIGGTNAHMILEEAPLIPQEKGQKRGDPFYLFTISAKSENALRNLASKYLSFFEKEQHYFIGNICFTSNIGRSHYPFRFSAVIDSTEQLCEQIRALISGVKMPSCLTMYPQKNEIPQVAYYFSSIFNDEFIPVSRFFYEKVSQFRKTIDYCAAILKTDHGKLLMKDLFKNYEEATNGYAKTTIFAIEYALFQMWNSWGILPSAIVGNGVGEYAAACAAGVFSVDDGLKMVSSIEDFDVNGAVIQKESKEFYIIKDIIDRVSLNYPKFDIVSISTGNLIKKQEMCDRNYWVSKIIEQPEFNVKWKYFREQGIDYFVIIGPDTKVRNGFKKENLSECVAVQSFMGDQNEWRRTLEYLGDLYVRGWDIDWNQFTKESSNQRISLPTYPFEKQRCWFEG